MASLLADLVESLGRNFASSTSMVRSGLNVAEDSI